MKIDVVVADLLARRDFFTAEMKKKLVEKGFVEEEVLETIERWQAKGYLSDADLALRFIEKYKSAGQGPSAIRVKLFMRSKNKDLLSLIKENPSEQREAVKQIVARKYRNCDWQDLKQKRKIFSYLLRKGFASDVISEVFREIEE